MRKIRVAIWGFGAMGKGIAEMLVLKKGIEVVGVCDLNKELIGTDFRKSLSVKSEHNAVVITDNIEEVLSIQNLDLVLIATDSYTKNSYPKICKVVEKGINVISTAEEMAYPYANNPKLSDEMNTLAKENGVTVLGTGINPGFIMDYLVVALTGVMENIKSIKVNRVNSLSPFGPTVMEEQGVGLEQEEYKSKMANNSLAGHVGFKESVYMIADAIGVKIDHFEQNMEPIISSVYRESKYAKVQPGQLAGINMTAFGEIEGEKFIEMKHPQQIEPEIEGTSTGDYINIEGKPVVNMSIQPEIDGGIGTISMCVNMIPHVLNASPGLKTMIDLPVPRAILGDMRNLLDK